MGNYSKAVAAILGGVVTVAGAINREAGGPSRN